MPSRLASALLRLPRTSGEVGDTLWRHANLEDVDAVGVPPTDQLLDEYSFVLSGEPAVKFARMVPDAQQAARLAGTLNPHMREGAAANPHIPDANLAALTGDKVPEVAEAARTAVAARAEARAEANAAEPDARKLLDLLDLEGIDQVAATSPLTIVAALVTRGDAGEKLTRIKAANPGLYSAIMLEWATSKSPFTAPIAVWLTASDLRLDTLLAGVTAQELRRRSTYPAMAVFMEAGAIPRPKAKESHASIEAMSIIMSPAELAGMLVGSDSPVDTALMDRILIKAAPTMVGNFFVGATQRRPRVGDVLRLLGAADTETRTAWCEAVAKQTIDFDAISAAPWAGELLLLGKLDWLAGLPLSAVAALDAVLTERLGDDQAIWEFAIVLAEEWETTLYDLLDTAVAMEANAE